MFLSLHKSDAIDYLRGLAAASVDCIITDPPYESLEKHRKVGNTTRLKYSAQSSNDWFPIFPNTRFESLFLECYRVLRKNRHLYMFCDQETMFYVKPIAEKCGFRFWKPLVWDKEIMGLGYHYRARYEFVLFFEKGKRQLNDLSIPDILEVKKVSRGYPTEKPYELSEILIQQSTNPGYLVVDPFCGSGSVGVAALLHGRRFSGVDISEKAITLCKSRLEGLYPPLRKPRQPLIYQKKQTK